jgi:DNA-binding NarL/FixJ family response regulator
MNTKIMLVDDHSIMREGLKALLGRIPDIEVVAEASTGRECLQKADEFSPDVIVMDLNMPEMDGIEATRTLLGDYPHIKVLVLSMLLDKSHVIDTLKAGARGFISKECVFEELVEAIRAVSAGKSYLGSKITDLVIEDYAQGPPEDASSRSGMLTQREREVLRHIADGVNTKEIALTLGVSVKTIEIHRMNIMKKLNLHSIAELTKYAIREGLTAID